MEAEKTAERLPVMAHASGSHALRENPRGCNAPRCRLRHDAERRGSAFPRRAWERVVQLARPFRACHPTALLLLVVFLATGCSRHGKAAPVGGSDVPPSKVNLKRNVELGRAEQRSIVYYVDTVGYIEAEGQTDIAAGVKGIVDEVLFREGDVVPANKVLIKVDQRGYQSAEMLAEANLTHAQSQVELAKDLERRAMRAGRAASEEEKSKATLMLQSAKADVESAKASLEMARNNLDRSRVRAPYAGVINSRKVTRGTFLEDKSIIATMADLSRLRLVGWIPESAAPQVRDLMAAQEKRIAAFKKTLPLAGFGAPNPWARVAGQLIVQRGDVPSGFDPEFVLLAFAHQSFRARIFFLATVADPTTHMFECKAEIDLTNVGAELRPGYTARIRVPLRSNSNAVVVPEEAVRASERGFIAFTPLERTGRDGRMEWVARAVTIEPGYRSPGWVEVRQGIEAGQLIVRRGAEALEDGTPIQFQEASGVRSQESGVRGQGGYP